MNTKLIKKCSAITLSTLMLLLVGCSSANKNTQTSSNQTSNNAQTETKKEVQKERKAEGKTVDLTAGNFVCGTDIEPGIYDLTPSGGKGQITVKTQDTSDTSLGCSMDTLGMIDGNDNTGISKMRLKLVKGDVIQINGVSITHFKPVTTPFVDKTPKNISLYAGRFVPGEDIAPGKYKITAVKGSGNVYIFSKSGLMQQNIADHNTQLTSDNPKEATITLNDGEPIFVTNIEQVDFTPVQ